MSIGLNVAEIPGSISMDSRMMTMCACLRLGTRKSATWAKSRMLWAAEDGYLTGCVWFTAHYP